MEPTELTLVHAIDTAPDAEARVDAIEALTARWQSTHEVHDVDVCVMSLHTHMLSAHIGVTRAVYAALSTLLETAAPQLSTARHVQTIVKLGVPRALERMPDVPAARAWLEQVRRIVHADVVGTARMRESDTPCTLWEHTIRDAGLCATSPRVRAATLQMLSEAPEQAALETYKPYLIERLHDADGDVRAAAKAAVHALYAHATPTQLSELREALPDHDGLETLWSQAPAPTEVTTPVPFWAVVACDDIRPVHVWSRYDVDAALQHAGHVFQGKETETNWQPREKAVVHLRGMLKAHVPKEHITFFASQMRHIQEGLLKTLASLRTTLSMHTIALIRQLALSLGAQLEHTMMDAFFTALVRMAGITKKLVASASQVAVDTILACFPVRHMHWQSLYAGLQDKSTATRVYMCKHVHLVLQVHGHKRAEMEAHHGLDMTRQCLERALSDPSAEVRMAARDVFGTFYGQYRSDADSLLVALPPATRKQVAASLDMPSSPVVTPRRPSSRAGPSRAIVAAKRAAMQQQQQQRETVVERPRLPRESVWHPSLVENGPDASTDLVGSEAPWHEREDGDGMSMMLQGLHIHTPRATRDSSIPNTPTTPVPAKLAAPAVMPSTASAWFMDQSTRAMQDTCMEAAPVCEENTTHWADAPASALGRLAQRLDKEAIDDLARVLDGMRAQLDQHRDYTTWLLVLTVLHRLAPYVCRDEALEQAWLAQVLRVPSTRPEHMTLAMGASRAMLEVWSKHSPSSAAALMDQVSDDAAQRILALYALEVRRVTDLEELRTTVPLVQVALRDPHTPVRRACVSFLVQVPREALTLYAPLAASEERLIQYYRDRIGGGRT